MMLRASCLSHILDNSNCVTPDMTSKKNAPFGKFLMINRDIILTGLNRLGMCIHTYVCMYGLIIPGFKVSPAGLKSLYSVSTNTLSLHHL